VWVATDEST